VAKRFLALLFSLVIGYAGIARAQQPVPALSGRVVDLTATLSANIKAAIESSLAQLEQEKGSQVAVLIVSTTEPEAIEQFGIRVAESWKLGRKGIDDGAILIIAKEDRALRIEVGYGLEGVLPDARAKQIVDDIIVPYFKAGDFDGGVRAGVNAVSLLIRGEPLPEPKWPSQANGDYPFIFLPFILLFLLQPILALFNDSRRVEGNIRNAFILSAITFVVGILTAPLLFALFFTIFAFIIGLAGRGSGWSSGGRSWSGGNWSSRGNGGFGGFSGGGGGFGGGGASGRW